MSDYPTPPFEAQQQPVPGDQGRMNFEKPGAGLLRIRGVLVFEVHTELCGKSCRTAPAAPPGIAPGGEN